MPILFSRRDLLRGFAATAGVPFQKLGFRDRPTIGIIGGGMAGVSLAWLLDGACDVVLLEGRDSIGGNVQSVDVELDGARVVVDMGAQYFHPGLYPLYTALLTYLGLHDPASPEASQTHAFASSITLTADAETRPRFVSPMLPDRAWPFLAPWNQAGVRAFAVGFSAAKIREQLQASWMLTLDEWLPTLGLAPQQWEGMLLPWAASLFSGSIDQARGLSARAAMIFAAKALPANPLDPILYYVLKPGMAEVLHRMIDQFSTTRVVTGSPVLYVTRDLSGRFRLHCPNGRIVAVDHVVFACSRAATERLVKELAGTGPQVAALRGIEFHDARLALHTDPIYAPASPIFRSFLNCDIQDGFCEASMWLGNILADAPPAIAGKLWKSWVTHRVQPAEILHEARFTHMLPTPATISAQTQLSAYQGRDGIWFAGGYLSPYDSQETALGSALRVAAGLQVTSLHSQSLLALPTEIGPEHVDP